MDASGWDERYAGSDLVWSAEPNRFVVDELADLPPGRALDLAAGEGRNAIWLARRGWDVTAVDFSPVGLDKGRAIAEHHGVPVTWVCADLVSYEPAPGSAELALIAYLQIPAAERGLVNRRAFLSLVPGGTLLVVGHDSSNLTDGVGGPQDPERLFTADDVLTELSDLPGLTVVSAGPRRRPATRADGTMGEAIDAVVRVTRA